jgi:hypothetical protein
MELAHGLNEVFEKYRYLVICLRGGHKGCSFIKFEDLRTVVVAEKALETIIFRGLSN